MIWLPNNETQLSILRAALSWWRTQGWVHADPTLGLERRPAPADRTRALTRDQLKALFALDVGLREKTYWRMLYETASSRQFPFHCSDRADT